MICTLNYLVDFFLVLEQDFRYTLVIRYRRKASGAKETSRVCCDPVRDDLLLEFF